MKPRISIREALYYLVAFAVCGMGCRAPVSESSATKPKFAETAFVKTKYLRHAELSQAELANVLSLAKSCGIPDVIEVETFYYLPSTSKGISAKGRLKVEGRNHSFDSIVVDRMGWSYRESSTNALHLDNLWATPTDRRTTLLRDYVINGTAKQIEIGKAVSVDLADMVISRVFSGRANLGSQYTPASFERLIQRAPTGIYRSENNEYELWFETSSASWDTLRLKVEGKEITITGSGSIVI